MLLYIQFLLLAIFAVIMTKFNKNLKFVCGRKRLTRIQWGIEWIILTLMYAIRLVDGTAGADSLGYRTAFEQGYIVSDERAYIVLSRLVSAVTSNYHIFFFVVYGFFVFGMLYFEYNLIDKKETLIVLLLYSSMFITAFGVMRQWIAIALGMVSFVLLVKEKKALSFIVACIAVGFHKTLIVYFTINLGYTLFRRYMKRISNSFLIITSLCVNLLFFVFRNSFIGYMSKTEYVAYVSKEALSSYSWLGYIPAIVFMVVTLLFSKTLLSEYHDNRAVELGTLYMWANLGLMYATVLLGMFRLYVIFFPIRVFMVGKMKKVLVKRLAVGRWSGATIKYGYIMLIILDFLLTAYRTISAGALPYTIDWGIFA